MENEKLSLQQPSWYTARVKMTFNFISNGVNYISSKEWKDASCVYNIKTMEGKYLVTLNSFYPYSTLWIISSPLVQSSQEQLVWCISPLNFNFFHCSSNIHGSGGSFLSVKQYIFDVSKHEWNNLAKKNSIYAYYASAWIFLKKLRITEFTFFYPKTSVQWF